MGVGFWSPEHSPTALATPTELPVAILRPLRDKIAMEKHRGVLECQMSRASAQVRWFKGSVELQSGPKYEMVSDGLYRKLIITDVQPEDEDTYTCDAGDVKTSAQFFVEGAGSAVRAPLPRACGGGPSSLRDRAGDQPLTHRAIHHHRARPAGRDGDGARPCLVRV